MPINQYVMKFMRDVPELKHCKQVLILKDDFSESKFHIIGKNNDEYLLVVYNSNSVDNYKLEIHNLLLRNRIPTNKIVRFGMCNYNKNFYILFTWMSGENLLSSISKANVDEQYKLGVEAGELLKKIHSIKHTLTKPNDCKLIDRIENLLKQYGDNCYRSYPLLDTFVKYIQLNKQNFNTQAVLLHGDYSLSNLLMCNFNLSVIDWVYGCFGDPVEDFVRNLVNADTSQDFACGLIDGYFNRKIPTSFWFKLKLYTAIQQVELIELNINSEYSKDTFINKNHKIAYQQYEKMRLLIPLYYSKRRHNNEFR